ncbi:OmpA family protein [Caldimonas thermodepolymerans]|uniref:OmpA family protein n=1 Tax=Caldimonas thermodepolymerans TaxID=215580 RepID=UPI00223623D9|nr:OmpA family protein [Caldimonas thermodepolymerans]UZG45909.1 OmpA family protein [Caldimonas thermodepolymerans]
MNMRAPFILHTVAAACVAFAVSACGDKPSEAPAAPPSAAGTAAPAGNEVLFEANQNVAVTGPAFIEWRDQMLAQGEGKLLQVTGRAYANESGSGGEDLGQARAEAASILFMEKLDPERIVLKSETLPGDPPSGRFEAVRFEWIDAPADAVAGAEAGAEPASGEEAATSVAAAPAPEPAAPAAEPAPATEPAPAPAPAASPAPAAADSVRALVLYFDTGSATPRLGAEERKQLQALVASAGEGGINVVGHADSRGAPEFNRTLSAARAVAVKRLLVRLGAKADAVQTSGQGSDQPVESNDAAAGRAKNRRVEISVM